MTLTRMSIAEARDALKAKKISARELADAHLKAMAETRYLNAFVTETPERALAMAGESDARRKRGEVGLLEGIPLGIKDLFCTEGVLTTAGSVLAVVGGALIVAVVPDGPYLTARAPFDARVALRVFSSPAFRYTAFGYFGHMWELYALWSLVAFYLRDRFVGDDAGWTSAIPLIAFATVAAGSVGCVAGGWVSRRVGERRVALVSLLVSGGLCVLSGFAQALPAPLLVAYLLVWGVFVVSDSPQFSALAARYCPPEYTATALTIQNGIGFAVTVVSIQLLPFVAQGIGWRWAFVALAAGPLLGAHFMRKVPRAAADS